EFALPVSTYVSYFSRLLLLLFCSLSPLPLFFFNDPPPPEIYTLSLHDALPIWSKPAHAGFLPKLVQLLFYFLLTAPGSGAADGQDRKSTRLNSSHVKISYAVFCLKKKKKIDTETYEKRAKQRDSPGLARDNIAT